MIPDGQTAGVGESLPPPGSVELATMIAESPSASPGQSGAAAEGWTLSGAFGLFNIVVGLMLVAAFLLFFGGFTGYITRLGLEGRSQGLTFMYRGISVLFVLIVLLAVVNFLQFHTEVALTIVAVLIVGFGGYAIVKTWGAGAAKEEEH